MNKVAVDSINSTVTVPLTVPLQCRLSSFSAKCVKCEKKKKRVKMQTQQHNAESKHTKWLREVRLRLLMNSTWICLFVFLSKRLKPSLPALGYGVWFIDSIYVGQSNMFLDQEDGVQSAYKRSMFVVITLLKCQFLLSFFFVY